MNDEFKIFDQRLIVIETQVGRLLSDHESEKDTRRRFTEYILDKIDVLGKTLDHRLRVLERIIWLAIGGVMVIEFLSKWVK
jgi:hypothetical protein